MSFNILHINLHSINNKTDLLSELIEKNKIDFAILQESWRKKQNKVVKIKSFNTIQKIELT